MPSPVTARTITAEQIASLRTLVGWPERRSMIARALDGDLTARASCANHYNARAGHDFIVSHRGDMLELVIRESGSTLSLSFPRRHLERVIEALERERLATDDTVVVDPEDVQ